MHGFLEKEENRATGAKLNLQEQRQEHPWWDNQKTEQKNILQSNLLRMYSLFCILTLLFLCYFIANIFDVLMSRRFHRPVYF